MTSLYVVLFALVLGVFSVVFYVGLSTALAPTFDIGPEVTSEQAAAVAHQGTVERVRLELIAGDLAVVVLVAGAAWILASRTLRPSRSRSLAR